LDLALRGRTAKEVAVNIIDVQIHVSTETVGVLGACKEGRIDFVERLAPGQFSLPYGAFPIGHPTTRELLVPNSNLVDRAYVGVNPAAGS
jgi:hypothetical protein